MDWRYRDSELRAITGKNCVKNFAQKIGVLKPNGPSKMEKIDKALSSGSTSTQIDSAPKIEKLKNLGAQINQKFEKMEDWLREGRQGRTREEFIRDAIKAERMTKPGHDVKKGFAEAAKGSAPFLTACIALKILNY